ncbi:MAG: hypothetical protein HZA17_03985 [Nitrospirae bacterium]|nr:hypothetical protein [Nitrospirota bacterium]
MVALAILGIAVVALFQLFSMTLRYTVKSENYTRALLHAKSMLDEAYAIPDLEGEGYDSRSFEGGLTGRREINRLPADDTGIAKVYEIVVTISWLPSGSLTLKGLRTIYEPEQ